MPHIELDTIEQQQDDALRILEKRFKKGDQVRYIPEIAKRNPNHESCQTGIVISSILQGEIFYVRYFRGLYLQATPEATAASNLIMWGEGLESIRNQ
jgi:hypothetical protein